MMNGNVLRPLLTGGQRVRFQGIVQRSGAAEGGDVLLRKDARRIFVGARDEIHQLIP